MNGFLDFLAFLGVRLELGQEAYVRVAFCGQEPRDAAGAAAVWGDVATPLLPVKSPQRGLWGQQGVCFYRRS